MSKKDYKTEKLGKNTMNSLLENQSSVEQLRDEIERHSQETYRDYSRLDDLNVNFQCYSIQRLVNSIIALGCQTEDNILTQCTKMLVQKIQSDCHPTISRVAGLSLGRLVH